MTPLSTPQQQYDPPQYNHNNCKIKTASGEFTQSLFYRKTQNWPSSIITGNQKYGLYVDTKFQRSTVDAYETPEPSPKIGVSLRGYSCRWLKNSTPEESEHIIKLDISAVNQLLKKNVASPNINSL